MGGAEVFTREVAERWVKAGHEVTLFTSEFPDCRHDEVLDGVRIVRSGGKYSVYSRAKKYYRMYFSKEDFDLIIDEVNTRPFFAPKFAINGEKVVCLIHQRLGSTGFTRHLFLLVTLATISLKIDG